MHLSLKTCKTTRTSTRPPSYALVDASPRASRQQCLQPAVALGIKAAMKVLHCVDLEEPLSIFTDHAEQADLEIVDIVVREAISSVAPLVRPARAAIQRRVRIRIERLGFPGEFDDITVLPGQLTLRGTYLPLEVAAAVVGQLPRELPRGYTNAMC